MSPMSRSQLNEGNRREDRKWPVVEFRPVNRPGLRGLHAYQVAIEFYRVLKQALSGKPKTEAVLQVIKSAQSTIRNIGEAHPALGADRARRFRIAANEASESIGSLDVLEINGTLSGATLAQLWYLLDRTCAMLWKLSR